MVWSNKGRVAVKSFFFRIQRTHCLLQIIAAGSVNYIPCKFIRASLSVFKTMAVPTIIFAGNPFLLRVQLVLLEKPLIVKLPRSCRRIGQLCLLMRPSKDKDVSWIASWMARLFSYSFSIGMRFFFSLDPLSTMPYSPFSFNEIFQSSHFSLNFPSYVTSFRL